MAFQLGQNEDQGMNEMNLIPLIDIMLVLMIIFLVTATVLNPTVPLNLPKTTAVVNDAPPETIQISINKEGKIFWDSTELSQDDLKQRLEAKSKEGQDPVIHLRADKDSRYDTVAQVLAIASGTGMDKIAFVNE